MKNILLIHGWNYENYYNQTNKNAWNNRIKFIKELKKKYNVYYPSLPGFGDTNEPNVRMWTLDDYANYIDEYIRINKIKVDYVLGYSFGGAVAVRYKELFKNDIKLILCSPALIRNTNKSKKFIRTPKLFDPLRNIIRNFYVTNLLKVNEMVFGTRFLRNTYQNIVRVNTLDILNKFKPNDYIIIYGDKDNMVNPHKVLDIVNNKVKKRIYFIKDGGHDIANTHTNDVVNIINDFTIE